MEPLLCGKTVVALVTARLRLPHTSLSIQPVTSTVEASGII
ncbi:MAG: hypothetical protein AAF915_26990 [Cyanobacteria bacterium P01_D01_bin.50]